MTTYSLTHRKEDGNDFEDITVFTIATLEQVNGFLQDRPHIAYQYYVTEYDELEEISEQIGGDEWLNYIDRLEAQQS